MNKLSSNFVKDYFLEREKEKEYCQKHKLFFEDIDGVKIFGTDNGPGDEEIKLSFEFNSGCAFDPPGKTEINHLLEHIFHYAFKKNFPDYQDNFDAKTDLDKIIQIYENNAKIIKSEKKFSQILSKLFTAINTKLDLLENIEKVVDREKKLIKLELLTRSADFTYWQRNSLFKTIFGPNNPWAWETRENNLDNIHTSEIEDLSREVICRENLNFKIINSSKKFTCSKIAEELKPMILKLPKTGKQGKTLDRSLLELTNPNFTQGKIYRYLSGIKYGLITIFFIWLHPVELFSPKHFDTFLFKEEFNSIFFSFIKNNAWSYSSGVRTITPNESPLVMYTHFTLPKTTIAECEDFSLKASELLKKELYTKMTMPRLEKFINNQQQNIKFIPRSTADRLFWYKFGQNNFNQPFDLDKINQAFCEVTPNRLLTMKEVILSTPPAILITGDF